MTQIMPLYTLAVSTHMDTPSSAMSTHLHHVKQPLFMRSGVSRIKAILALLDQLTSFGQRESLTIHASMGSGQMSAVSSAQSVNMLQSVAARWRCTK